MSTDDLMQFDSDDEPQQSSRSMPQQTRRSTPVLFVADGKFFQPPVPELQSANIEQEDLHWQDKGTTLCTACSAPGLWEPSMIETDENGQLTVTLMAAERTLSEQPREEEAREVALMSPEVVVGRRVETRGLKSRPELNGAFGRVREFDSKRGRFSVHLDTDEVVGLKPTNLTLADDGDAPKPPVDAEAAAWNELRPLLRCVRRFQLPAEADLDSADLSVTHEDGTLRIEVAKTSFSSQAASKLIAAECDPDSIMDIDMTGPTGVVA